MKTYPKYKDSGIDWLGDIPAHWSVRRLKDLISLCSGDTLTSTDLVSTGQYPVYGGNGIRGSHDKYNRDGEFVLIGRVGALCGNIHLVHGKFWATEHALIGTILGNTDATWLAYILEKMKLGQYSQTTAQPVITQLKISSLFLCIPPLEEQRAIADYLDEKCGAIDKQVALLERKREAYVRLKTSLINRVVTRGLDPSVAMRPSGIDWLGDIPAHWSVRRFKEMFSSYTTGITPESKNDNFFEVDDGHTWITIADMNSKFVSTSNLNLSQTAVNLFQPPITKRGSLMFSFKLSIGKICFAQKDLYTNEAIVSIPPQDDFDMNFIYYLLPKILRLNATENIYGAKMLNKKIIANMRIMFPPIDEQRAIASYLDEKCGEIDAAIEITGKQIDAYKRLKRSLINEVVTGQRAV